MPFIQREQDKFFYTIDHCKKDTETNTTIILLHNNISDHNIFNLIFPYLNQEFTIIRFDLRGFGLSQCDTQELTYEIYVEDLHFLIKSLRIRSFILVGMGFSALIACRFTNRYKEFVEKLILISMACNPPHMIGKVKEHRKKISKYGTFIPIDYIIKMGSSLPSNHPAIMNWRKSISQTHPSVYSKIMELSISDDPLKSLKEITAPTLILSGSEDLLFPQHYMKSMVTHLPHCHHMTIPGSASFVVLDKPQTTALLILDFIKGNKHTHTVVDETVTSIYGEVQQFAGNRYTIEETGNNNHIQINIIQSFHVYVNGKEIVEGWNKRFAKNILIFLLFHPTTTREHLCEALWPDTSIQQSKKNLTVYLSYLRGLLHVTESKQSILVTDRQSIHLNAKLGSDALDFLSVYKKAVSRKDSEMKLDLCQRLVDFLPLNYFPAIYDDWFLGVINRIEEEIADLFIETAGGLIQNNNTQAAIQFLKKSGPFFNEETQNLFSHLLTQLSHN